MDGLLTTPAWTGAAGEGSTSIATNGPSMISSDGLRAAPACTGAGGGSSTSIRVDTLTGGRDGAEVPVPPEATRLRFRPRARPVCRSFVMSGAGGDMGMGVVRRCRLLVSNSFAILVHGSPIRTIQNKRSDNIPGLP